MTLLSTKIFSKGARPGVIRYWQFEVDGDKWRGHYGEVGGKDAVSGWRTAKVTNAGKANERSPQDQAHAEAAAEETKKLAREYRQVVTDLESVPPDVMLAETYSKLKKPLRFNPGRLPRVQPKLDGIRLVASERFLGTSRDFQPFFTVSHILEEMKPVWAKYPDLILDGELYNHSLKHDFNKISSLVRKETLTPEQLLEVRRLVEYHVYDMPSHPGNFSERRAALVHLSDEFNFDLTPIVLVPTYVVPSLNEIEAHYETFLEAGYEGLMVRQDEPYDFGVRSWSLMKHKGKKTTEEFTISKLIEGNGNFAGMAKAVEFLLDANDTRGPTGKRPKAGIKGEQDFCRELLTKTPAPTIVTVEYFGRTPAGMLRFPVAVDWHYGQRKD